MRSDSDIETDVENELRFTPDLDSSNIAVAVNSGVVTLAGYVGSYDEKLEAAAAAKRVKGVVGLADDVEVRLSGGDRTPDPDIARDAVAAIRHRVPDGFERIKVVVRNGWIELEGEVEWDYQRVRAERAVRRLTGVKGVTNSIKVKPQARPDEIKRKIEEVFRRSAEIEANNITVEADAGEVILRGTVRSWAEREEAERAAWAAPGVIKVDDRITIDV
jgi:osmotically-inducible protein OsmY